MNDIRIYGSENACNSVWDSLLYQENPEIFQSIAPLESRQSTLMSEQGSFLSQRSDSTVSSDTVFAAAGGVLDFVGVPGRFNELRMDNPVFGPAEDSIDSGSFFLKPALRQGAQALGGILNTYTGVLDMFNAISNDRRAGDPLGTALMGSLLKTVGKSASTYGILTLALGALTTTATLPVMLAGGAALGSAYFLGRGIDAGVDWGVNRYRQWMGIAG